MKNLKICLFILGALSIVLCANAKNVIYTNAQGDSNFNAPGNWKDTAGKTLESLDFADVFFFRGAQDKTGGVVNVTSPITLINSNVQSGGFKFQNNTPFILKGAPITISGKGSNAIQLNAVKVPTTHSIENNIVFNTSDTAATTMIHLGANMTLKLTGNISITGNGNGIGINAENKSGVLNITGNVQAPGKMMRVANGTTIFTGRGNIACAMAAAGVDSNKCGLIVLDKIEKNIIKSNVQVYSFGEVRLDGDEQISDLFNFSFAKADTTPVGRCVFNLNGRKETIANLNFQLANNDARILMGNGGSLTISKFVKPQFEKAFDQKNFLIIEQWDYQKDFILFTADGKAVIESTNFLKNVGFMNSSGAIVNDAVLLEHKGGFFQLASKSMMAQ